MGRVVTGCGRGRVVCGSCSVISGQRIDNVHSGHAHGHAANASNASTHTHSGRQSADRVHGRGTGTRAMCLRRLLALLSPSFAETFDDLLQAFNRLFVFGVCFGRAEGLVNKELQGNEKEKGVSC